MTMGTMGIHERSGVHIIYTLVGLVDLQQQESIKYVKYMAQTHGASRPTTVISFYELGVPVL